MELVSEKLSLLQRNFSKTVIFVTEMQEFIKDEVSSTKKLLNSVQRLVEQRNIFLRIYCNN